MKQIRIQTILVAFFLAGTLAVYGQDQEGVPEETLTTFSLEELMNLKVTVASKEAETITDAAGVISVVRREDIERFGGLTLRDILERVPSLTRAATASTEGYGLASRGDQVKETTGHILILVNGRPVREVLEGGISSETLAGFPVNTIERIEVIRGPGSVLYGSNAFSAVINIVTIEEQKSNVAVSGITSLNGAVGATANGTVKAGDLSVTLGGRYLDKGDRNLTYTGTSGGGPGGPPGGGGTTTTEEKEINLTDEAKAGFMALNYKGLSLNSFYTDYDAKAFNGGGSMNAWTKWFNNLGYKQGVIQDKWDMEFNVTYTRATLDAGGPGIERESSDFVAEWTNHVKLGSDSRLIVGGLYNYIEGDEIQKSSQAYISDGSRGSLALYSQVDWWLIKTLKVIGGFQANKVQDHDINVVPRLGAIWYPVERLNVKALYAQAFRAPSINELNLQHQGRLGNEDLDPEMVTSYDFGVNYQGQKISLGVNYFINNQRDIIALDGGTYQNLSTIDFHGIEFEGRYYLSKEIYIMGSLLEQHNKDGDGNEDITPIAITSFKGGVSYASDKGVTVSLFDIYSGNLGDAYTSVGSGTQSAGPYNILNAYASLELLRIFKINTASKLSFFVQANDILDEEIWIPAAGSISSTLPTTPGRAVYMGLKASLK